MLSLSRGREFLNHVVPGVIKPMRVLWNQVIGFTFFVFALIAVPRGIRSWREYDGDAQSLFEVILTFAFVLAMLGFALQSFWRARKVSRQRVSLP